MAAPLHLPSQDMHTESGEKDQSFSCITWDPIAPHIGLRPENELRRFPLKRARIPNELLKSISIDMGHMLNVGPRLVTS